jgi:hypothetical protein
VAADGEPSGTGRGLRVAVVGYGGSMRTVMVFPGIDQAQAVAVLDSLAQQREPYHIDGCLHAGIVQDNTEPRLFCGWEQAEIEALERVVGHRPTWCVMMHTSWTAQAPSAARQLTLALLRNGGAAIDDYSFHPWTAHEIVEDHTIDGARFCHPGA